MKLVGRFHSCTGRGLGQYPGYQKPPLYFHVSFDLQTLAINITTRKVVIPNATSRVGSFSVVAFTWR